MTKQELLNNEELLFDKAYGAMAGLAIGDSFGDASRKPENQLSYGFTADFNKEASWSTDDTEFALLTASILIDCGSKLDDEAMVKGWTDYVIHQNEFNRGGSSEIEAAINLRRGLRPPFTGQYNAYSHSDGAAMRVAPIGVVCAGDPEKAAVMAEIDARISHHREGVWGAQAVAVAVSLAMVDEDMAGIMKAVNRIVPQDSWFAYSLRRVEEIIEEAKGSILDAWMPLHDELKCSYKAVVPEAVAQAFGVLQLVNSDFRMGVVAAGNFGRDADTIGAIAGAVLGARYGASAIPPRWLEKTRYPSGTCLSFAKGLDLRQVGQDLAGLAKK